MFDAILVDKSETGQTVRQVQLSEADLPPGDVLVQVACSTINYKDGLALTGRVPVVRRFPMVPGIDFAGTVLHSDHAAWQPGDQVILNGWGVGEEHWGGWAEKARVNGDWLVALPAGMSMNDAMAIGTAGYTAMLCVLALERHGLLPGDGEVLVTGASGGVGSVAVALLARLGYTVVASTGRLEETGYLQDLGAHEVVDRQIFSQPGKPLQKERWAGVIDSVGSHTLVNACAGTRAWGAVAACGLAQGMDFPSSVAPFILRGVTLYGINSVTQPLAHRVEAWDRLARDLDRAQLRRMTHTVSLAEVPALGERILAGQIRGRTVVQL